MFKVRHPIFNLPALACVLAVLGVASAAPSAAEPTLVKYREVDGTALQLHIFQPPDAKPGDARTGLLFFFGGGWSGSNIGQFYPFARHFAEQGCVVFCAEYRVGSLHKTKPQDAVEDAKAALAFVRNGDATFGVSPDRIVVGGGSSGGHLAACTAAFGDPAAQPAALLLLGSVLDTSANGFTGGRKPGSLDDISPQHHIRPGLPPTLVLHGTADKTVRVAQARKFAETMKAAGNDCELELFEGAGHGFFNSPDFKPGSSAADHAASLASIERFLTAHRLLPGKP